MFVTERATNQIGVFPLTVGGLLGAPSFFASSGVTPFGFGFGRHDSLIVSEAAAGAVNGSSVSSYTIGVGNITSVTPAAPTTEAVRPTESVSNPVNLVALRGSTAAATGLHRDAR